MSLELISVSRSFGEHRALSDVTLSVHPGDCYGFLGHNGAGKTTALRIALGLMEADGGRIVVDGLDIRRYPREARARLGGLIEVPGFHGSASGRKNLLALARLQGLGGDAAARATDEALDMVGLLGVGKKPVRVYSQGMRQRLGVAQALLGRPRYVLLDEPGNGLDPEGLSDLRSVLRRLRDEAAVSVLMSSHQLGEVADLCNRVGVLKQGRLLLEDDVVNLTAAGGRRCEISASPADRVASVLRTVGIDHAVPPEGSFVVSLTNVTTDVLARELVLAGCSLHALAPRPFTLEEVYLSAGTSEAPTSSSRRAALGDPAASARTQRAGAGASSHAKLAPRWPRWRVFRYDTERWIRSIPVVALLLAPAVLAAAGVFRRFQEDSEARESVAAGINFSTTQVTAFEALGWSFRLGLPILAYIAAGLASQSIASEFAQGTLRNVVLRPVTRWQVAFGKAASLLFVVGVAYACLVGAAFAAAAYFFDFTGPSEILPNGEMTDGYALASVLWEEVPPLVWSPLLPLAAYTALGFLLGAVARRGTTALVSVLVALAVLDFGRIAARSFRVEAWLPSVYLPSPLGDNSYVDFYVNASTGAGNSAFAYASTAITHPLAWTLVAMVLGAWVLRRRSIP